MSVAREGYKLICGICGETFVAKNKRYGDPVCRKCKEHETKRIARSKRAGARVAKVAKGGDNEIATIAARAREAHMTYGRYVAAQRGGA